MLSGLFIGRFQPFHLGHLSAVKQAFDKVDFLTIGIGSAQYSDTDKNPFTAQERTEIIKKSLEEAGVKPEQYAIVSIPDIHDNENWADHVKTLVPDFDVLFLSNTEIVKELFEKYSPETELILLEKEIDISATELREKMMQGDDWKSDLSKKTATYIEEIGGATRIKPSPL